MSYWFISFILPFAVQLLCMYVLLRPYISFRYSALATALLQSFFVGTIFLLLQLIPARKEVISTTHPTFQYWAKLFPVAVWILIILSLISLVAFVIELFPAFFLFKNVSKKKVASSLFISIVITTVINWFFNVFVFWDRNNPL